MLCVCVYLTRNSGYTVPGQMMLTDFRRCADHHMSITSLCVTSSGSLCSGCCCVLFYGEIVQTAFCASGLFLLMRGIKQAVNLPSPLELC